MEESVEEPRIDNVGETFVEWAEKYWRFEESFTREESEGESCPYSYIRETFISKINELTELKK